jgi:hypothetical protein
MAYKIMTWDNLPIATEANLNAALGMAHEHSRRTGELTKVRDGAGDGYDVSMFDGKVVQKAVEEPDHSDPDYWDESE